MNGTHRQRDGLHAQPRQPARRADRVLEAERLDDADTPF